MEERKSYWRNLIFIILVIAAASVFYLLRGDSGVSFDLDGSSFVLRGPEEYTASVDLAALRAMELRERLDYGSAAGGSVSGRYAYGVWENAEFGRYRLCVSERVPNCIVLTETDGTVTVCNFESKETTAEFYDALLNYAAESGYYPAG